MGKRLKKMSEDRLKQEIYKFLEERKVLILCTCLDDVPRATPMDFYVEKDDPDFAIYVAPAPGRKVENIKANPVISIGIYTPLSTGKIQGMQITSSDLDHLIFMEEGDEGFEKAQKVVRGRRKLILKILPKIIELLDYDFMKEGLAKHQTLDLS